MLGQHAQFTHIPTNTYTLYIHTQNKQNLHKYNNKI